jgi:L-fucose isomerase-like protein
MMGYRDMNLYGTMFDGMSLKKVVGVEIEFFEMLEIVQNIKKLDSSEIDRVVDYVTGSWVFEKKAAGETLKKGVELYLGIKEKVLERGYEAVSLIDVDGVKKLMNFTPAMAFMLLGDDPGVCTIPENDALGAVTQLLTKYLTGQAAPYFEFYEFMEDRVLMGVPDFVPTEVVDGKVTVKATAFGGFGEGVLNISRVKTGRVTISRLNYEDGVYSLHLVTGEAVTPRSWEEAGWESPAPQLPSLEIILDTPVEEFAQEVLSQHYILSYGDNTRLFREACRILGIKMY